MKVDIHLVKNVEIKQKNVSNTHKVLETMEPKTLQGNFDKFMLSDIKVFSGFTPFQIINEHDKDIEAIKLREEETEEKRNKVISDQLKINEKLDDYTKEVRRLKEENLLILDELKFIKRRI